MSTNEKQKLNESIQQTANEYSQAQGYANTKEAVGRMSRMMSSESPVTAAMGERMAGDFTQSLLGLTLYQNFYNQYDLGAYSWINKFDDQIVNQGNQVQYTRQLITGNDQYDEALFNPTSLTYPKLDVVAYIKLYKTFNGNQNSDLATFDDNGCKGYKFKKPQTLIAEQWIPYFKSGKLMEFIGDVVSNMSKSYNLFKVNLFEEAITKIISSATAPSNQGQSTEGTLNANHVYKFNGNSADMLSSFTKEIFPLITSMKFLTNKYNLRLNGNATGLNNAKPEDILMFVNQKTYTRLNNGVLANVFNNKLAEIEAIIPKENIICTGNKTNSVTGSSTAITMSSTPLIGDNQVLIMTKDCLKHLTFLQYRPEEQLYTTNLARQITLHAWGSLGFIPWGQCVLYENNNLGIA